MTDEKVVPLNEKIEERWIEGIVMDCLPHGLICGAVEGLHYKISRSAFIEHLTARQIAELKQIIQEVFGKVKK